MDEAVRWYMYEKQLYNLKRITRTETARILNTAIVESYKDNPFVVGFKWELNPAHKIVDICDKYASVDFGLGRGYSRRRNFRTAQRIRAACVW